MTLVEFLAHLHSLDIQLAVDGDRLRVNAPKGVLTPELGAELTRRKPALLEALRHAQATNPAQPFDTTSITAIPRQGALPLSFAQQRLWFLDQLDPGNRAYNLPGVLRLQGRLDIPVLEASVTALIARHEALRTTITAIQGEPMQQIAPPTAFVLPIEDLRHLPAAVAEARAMEWCRDEAHAPFDLARGPLFRLTLLRLTDDTHLLVLTMHHIISDGWSLELFTQELARLYLAKLHRQPDPLAPLPIQYADYASWQREWLQGPELQRQLAYWQRQLAGPLPVLGLPTDLPRPAVQSYRGAKVTLTLDRDLTHAVKTLCQREEVTPFMLLLAAFNVLLYRYSGQTDLLVGTPVAGRNLPETTGLLGCFLNNLVLRTDLAGNPPFTELLRQVREVALTAYAHQDLPFEKLVEELQPVRDMSRPPLFQVMFLQNVPMAPLDLGELAISPPAQTDNAAAAFDITLSVRVLDEQIVALLEYNTDLFRAPTMRRFLGHYQRLLECIVANPTQGIAELPVLPAAERAQLLTGWNATQADYPHPLGVHELIAAQARQRPQVIAARLGEEVITYGTLDRQSNQLARHLQALGITPGTLVGLYVERGLDMLVAMLGILKAGAAYLPLDPAFPRARLAFMLEDAQVPLVLTQAALRDDLPPDLTALCLDRAWTELAQVSDDPIAVQLPPDPLAYVIYTSGSTGNPKGVQVRHQGVVNFLCAMQARPGIDMEDVLAAVTTLAFDIAVLELLLPLTVGAQVVIVPRSIAADGSALAELLHTSGATMMQATPATWRLLIGAGWAGHPDFKALCGGEALPRTLADQLLPRCATLWNMYGPTETTIWSMVHQVTQDDPPNASGTVSIGRPIANTQLYILDAHRQPVPIGVVGDLYIGGDGLARGYLNRPELTAERFIPHPFAAEIEAAGTRIYMTGDVARYGDDGTIEFLGRSDHQVKVRGFRIELGEIESNLARHPAIHQAVAVVHVEDGEPQIAAYFVLSPGAQLPNTTELRDFLHQYVPAYMLPAFFIPLDALPLTPNGKVDRNALPAPAGQRPDLHAVYTPPQGALEEQLASLWQELLKVDRVGVHDNFFELGGHSLLLAQVHAQIQTRFQLELPIVKLFQYPTIGALAAYMADGAAGDRAAGAGYASMQDRASQSKQARLRQQAQREHLAHMRPG